EGPPLAREEARGVVGDDDVAERARAVQEGEAALEEDRLPRLPGLPPQAVQDDGIALCAHEGEVALDAGAPARAVAAHEARRAAGEALDDELAPRLDVDAGVHQGHRDAADC